MYVYCRFKHENGKRNPKRFSLSPFTVVHCANEGCHLSVCFQRNKQKLPICKRTKQTKQSCPSMALVKSILNVVSVTDKGTEMCVYPGGSEAILSARERGGPGPPGGGGKRTVGIRQWRRLDTPRCQKAWGTSSARHQDTIMHRVCIIRESCAIICHNLNDCNHDPCLTVSICFRRINHMAVKNHLHSSSGV